MRSRARLPLSLFITVSTLLCAGSQFAAAQTLSLRYAQSYSAIRSIFSLPVTVAERAGFFRREKLDFHVVVPLPGGSDKMLDALNDGSADVTHIATAFLIRAVLAGADARAVAAEFNNPIYSLVARSEIKSFADLKGKLIGLADEAGSITLSTRKLLALHGLRNEDFRVRIIEGTPARYTCLRRGECDAVPLGQPQDLLAVKDGNRLLGLSTEAVPEFVYTVTAARRSWASANKEALVRYVRGLGAALKFIRDPANRKTIVKIIVETTDSSARSPSRRSSYFLSPSVTSCQNKPRSTSKVWPKSSPSWAKPTRSKSLCRSLNALSI